MESGANGRIIKVINFLASHPAESFTVSEIAERLSLSFGSAHRVLMSLSDAGYLARHPKHKTYSLGVTLIAIGQVALEKHKVVDIAQQEMAKVAAELGTECIASVITGDEVLYLAKKGSPAVHSGITRIGDRRPLVPPVGMCHLAWSSPASIEAYLQRATSGLSTAMRAYLKQAIVTIRDRGYSISTLDRGITALSQLVADHVDSYQSPAYWAAMDKALGQLSENEIQLLSLDDLGSARISHISVPVFSASSEVILELTLAGLPLVMEQAEIEARISRMRAAADYVTGEVHGRKPALSMA